MRQDRGEMKTMCRTGFTLIELLVVIAIIAILAAILFPVFLRAKQSAYVNKCLAHGRQLGIAMMSYMEDYQGFFPCAPSAAAYDKYAGMTWEYDWPGTPRVDGPWGVNGLNAFRYITLAKYAQKSDLWICPGPEGHYGTKYAYGYRNSWFFIRSKIGYSNSANYPDTPFQRWYGYNDPRNGKIGMSMTDVYSEDLKTYKRYTSPSTKIFAFCYALGPDIPVEAYAGSPNLITPYYPHRGGSIYVYTDGHAGWGLTGCGWAPVGYTKHRMDRNH